MRAMSIGVGFLLSLVTVTASAQVVDFSGKWKVNHAAGDPPSGSTAEQIWDIAQSANELRIRVIVNGREVSAHTWPLNGPPVSARRDGLEMTTSVAIAKIRITGTATSKAGTPMDVQEHWLLDPETKAFRVAKVMSNGASTFSRHLVLERVANPRFSRPWAGLLCD